ncbi:MAG TPA: hypothetical protein VIU82_10410 [Bosea sp. (in: a-proteobacteria)]
MAAPSEISVSVEPAAEDAPGATASFPYDATLIERFRLSFPRARWRDDRRAWFVPGTRAERRLNRWLERELSGALAYADERGRDAFLFDPIESRYLEPERELLVRTPYSKTVVEELRAVPWAWWDGDERVWRVPFRSIEDLRKRWPTIEAAAIRNEPEERRRRRDEFKASPEYGKAKAVSGEKRRRRYPVPAGMLPPLDRPLLSHEGAVAFTEVTGEVVDADVARQHYPWSSETAGDLVWALWRRPSHDELVRTWPARQAASVFDKARGWWQPTIDELRDARRKAKSLERAQAARRKQPILTPEDDPPPG